MAFNFVREFITEKDFADWPAFTKPVVCFVGRSNVGKSSLLNRLTGQTISRVSQEPGRTRGLLLFDSPDMVYIDLPGYGFAKVRDAVRADLMVNFFKYTPIALCLFLIDVRRGLGPLDQQVYNLVEPFVKRKNIIFLLTKGDKVLKRKYDENAAHKAEIKWASASGVSLDEVRLISNSWEDSWLGLRDLIRKKVLD